MLQTMTEFFVSGFVFNNLSIFGIITGIALGLVFGAIWLGGYLPPLLKKHSLWAVLAGSAVLSWAAVSFIQIPLQAYTGRALGYFWDTGTIMRWLLLAGIPQILLSGLVQEGSKLVPVIIYRWRCVQDGDTRLGLITGAISGAGLGVFEAVWVHNTIFAAGWSWQVVQTSGLIALIPFWERFFAVAFHIGSSALAGYGWYKGLRWQFYLVAALLHSALNYGVVLLRAGIFSVIQIEIYVAVIAVAVTAVALWLRWRKLPATTIGEAEFLPPADIDAKEDIPENSREN